MNVASLMKLYSNVNIMPFKIKVKVDQNIVNLQHCIAKYTVTSLTLF